MSKKGTDDRGVRIERDSLGAVEVPPDRLWARRRNAHASTSPLGRAVSLESAQIQPSSTSPELADGIKAATVTSLIEAVRHMPISRRKLFPDATCPELRFRSSYSIWLVDCSFGGSSRPTRPNSLGTLFGRFPVILNVLAIL